MLVNLKDDKYHGQGTVLPDGTKYIGEWKNDLRTWTRNLHIYWWR